MTETATIRGARIAYEQSGTGPDLIWGHGLSQTPDSPVGARARRLGTHCRPRTRDDACGHGESTTTPDLDGYGWAELAADQLALADHLGIDTYVAAGASMGCGTALHVVVRAPERVRALALVIPPTAWETRVAQADLWAQSAAVIESDGLEAVIAACALLEPPDPFRDDPGYR